MVSPKSFSRCSTSSLSGINYQSCLIVWSEAAELFEEFLVCSMTSSWLHWFNNNCSDWAPLRFLCSQSWAHTLENSRIVLSIWISYFRPSKAWEVGGASELGKSKGGMVSMCWTCKTKSTPFSCTSFSHCCEDSFLNTLTSSGKGNSRKMLGCMRCHQFSNKQLEILICYFTCCKVGVNQSGVKFFAMDSLIFFKWFLFTWTKESWL